VFAWLGYNALMAVPFAVVALLAERFQRRRPGVVHLLWLVVLIRLVLPPVPLGPLGLFPSGATAAGTSLIASEPSLLNEIVVRITRTFGASWSVQGLKILLGVFLVLGLWLLIGEVRRLVRLRRCLSTSVRDPEAERRTRQVARRFGVEAPEVRRTGAITTPCVLGFARPVLLLPLDGGEPSPVVLAHEIAHVRRRDHLASWLDLIVLGLHFWNPLFWFARRRMYLAAEWACDAWAVARYPSERAPYAESLVDAVERASFAPVAHTAVRAVGVGAGELEERLTRILAGEDAARTPRFAVLGVGLLLLASAPGVLAPPVHAFRAALPSLPAGADEETWQRYLDQGDELLATEPGRAEQLRGMGFLGLGRFDEALAAFQRQAEHGYRPGNAHYNSACALSRAGRYEEARGHLELALPEVDVADFLRRDPDLGGLRADPETEAWASRLGL